MSAAWPRGRAGSLAEDAREDVLEALAIGGAGAGRDVPARLVLDDGDAAPGADAVLVRVLVAGSCLRLVRCACGEAEEFVLLGDGRAPVRLGDFHAARQALFDAVLAAVALARSRACLARP